MVAEDKSNEPQDFLRPGLKEKWDIEDIQRFMRAGEAAVKVYQESKAQGACLPGNSMATIAIGRAALEAADGR